MAYLRPYDLTAQIQQLNLNQITNNTAGTTNPPTNVSDYVSTFSAYAEEEMTSYLTAKYNCADEFTDTGVFDNTQQYGGGGRFELNFLAYSTGTTYFVGNTCSVGTNQYICTANTGPGSFQPMDWQLIGQQFDLGYLGFPYPMFDYLAFYRPGQRVFWQGSVYQCTQETLLPDHQTLLQAYRYSNVGPPNAFPGSVPFGYPGNYRLPQQQWTPGTPYVVSNLGAVFEGSVQQNWSSSTAYTPGDWVYYGGPFQVNAPQQGAAWQCVTANTGVVPGADIVSWQPVFPTSGDNRSQMLVMTMVDIALYHLHARISPKNVPELRALRYKMALKWLEACARGEVTPQNLELNQPEYGSRISFGSRIKNINSF